MATDARKHSLLSGYRVLITSDTETMNDHGPRITSFLNPVNSANALYMLFRTVILFYLHYINTFVLSRLFLLSGQVPALSSPEKRRSSAIDQFVFVSASPSQYTVMAAVQKKRKEAKLKDIKGVRKARSHYNEKEIDKLSR